MSTKNWY